MINAGDYDKKISIYQIEEVEDNDGFVTKTEAVILEPFAKVKTTKGYTLIASGSDFEKAYKTVEDAYYNSNRKVYVKFKDKIYTVEYLNNIDEANIELELQCKRVTK